LKLKKFNNILSADDKEDAPENGKMKGGGKHRGPCESLANVEHMQAEVVKPAKNQNESFGHGMVLKITCDTGYNSNIQTANSTVRCNKGVWKPVRPTCSLSKKFMS
jgi:Sushi repeat (SCR repeat)